MPARSSSDPATASGTSPQPTFPSTAGPDEIAARWRAIYRLNRTLIGADPNLILPGQRLVLPR